MRENIYSLEFDKGLILRIHKELLKLKNNNKNNSVQKMSKGLHRHFSKEDTPVTNKHMKRCLTSLTIREWKSELHWDYTSYPPGWHLSKNKQQKTENNTNQKMTGIGEDVEKLELLCTIDRIVKWYCNCGKQYNDSSKKLKIELPYYPAILLLGYKPKKYWNQDLKRYPWYPWLSW